MSAGVWRRRIRVVDLLDQEVRHVGTGDEPRGPVARIDQNTIAPRPWSVRQNGWTNDRPVEPTAADDAFLHILVGVNAAKEEAKGGVVEEATVATAVPAPKPVTQIKRLTGLFSMASTSTRVAVEKSCVPETIRPGTGITPSV